MVSHDELHDGTLRRLKQIVDAGEECLIELCCDMLCDTYLYMHACPHRPALCSLKDLLEFDLS